jgi:hypothetical protein
MGFLSNLFGGNKEEQYLQDALKNVHRMIEDEEFQLEMLNPTLKEIIKSSPSYDRDPNGSGQFGFAAKNPIPVNGPIGQIAYLSKLETNKGERILFHRIGAINSIDVFEAVTFSGSEWFIFFTDLYHPRRSRLTPEGFRFTREVPQFCGFHKFCQNFPYDFVEMKASERESGLSVAYIALSKVVNQIQSNLYKRPLAHNAKLDLLKSQLTSFSK